VSGRVTLEPIFLGGVGLGGAVRPSPGIWEYAICPEVFARNNLVVASLLLLGVRASTNSRKRGLL
jgi:hypothetical protein